MPHKVFKLTIDLGDDVVWVCKVRRHSREEKHTLTQKHNAEYASTKQQQTQQKPQDQNPPLSQGQQKQFKDPKSQAQGKRQHLHFPNLSEQNQAEQRNRQKLWDRCLRERQQIHQYQREIQHERLQKQYQHCQQHVQPEPFHWQFTDEMQKLQDKVKQERLLQERHQQFKDQIQDQLQKELSQNEDECPIPPEYRKAQAPPAQQRLNSQYQPQEGEKQSRVHDESGIPDFPPSPFGTDEDSNDSDEEGYLESEEGEYGSEDKRNGSDNDLESHSETESESKVEEDKDEEDEEDNLGNESGFVFI